MVDPISRMVQYGSISNFAESQNPDRETQLPANKDIVAEAKQQWEADPTESHCRQVISALRTCGMHQEADD
ncbi:MAG TPA: hypothetical protein VK171_06035, partial [Fimbriimonas sp.]|nr:hypothetical protein [Fimbriimonas sp.]